MRFIERLVIAAALALAVVSGAQTADAPDAARAAPEVEAGAH